MTAEPRAVGPANVDVMFFDAAQRPIGARSVEIEATMTHPGMSPSLAHAHQVERGHFRASVQLTMAGDWIVIVTATLDDGRHLERTLPLPDVRP